MTEPPVTRSLLLEHFERLSEAPGAVERLRRFVVDLAIAGRLVRGSRPAELGELPAQAQKANAIARQVPARCQAHSTTGPPIDYPADTPFVPLGMIARLEKGATPIQRAKPGSYPLVTLAEGRLSCSTYQFDAAAVIVPLISSAGHGRASMNRLHYEQGKFAVGNILCAAIPIEPTLVSARFLFEYLTAYKEALLVSRMKGTANVSLTIGRIAGVPVPLVSRASQARVEELMTLFDELEAAQAKREKRRQRLVTASLRALTNGDDVGEPANAQAREQSARFYLDHLPRLTTRPEHIQHLREAILDLAATGRLVPQNADEGPARSTWQGPSSGGTVRRGVPAYVERPPTVASWTLPDTWAVQSAAELLRWGYLFDLKDGNHGANHPKASEFTRDGVPFITAAQVSDHCVSLESAKRLSGVPLQRLRVGFAHAGDVILTHKGSVGRTAIAHGDCVLSPQATYYRPNPELVFSRYLMWFMESSLFRAQLEEVKGQTTRDFVPITKQYRLFHAIPPIVEQHRIAAKVDELIALCDAIEASMVIRQVERARLLEAALDSVFADPILSAASGDAS